MNVGEEDGRSCYGIIAETSSSISSGALQVLNSNTFLTKAIRYFLFRFVKQEISILGDQHYPMTSQLLTQ